MHWPHSYLPFPLLLLNNVARALLGLCIEKVRGSWLGARQINERDGGIHDSSVVWGPSNCCGQLCSVRQGPCPAFHRYCHQLV
jgi:hypothetical protein